MISVTITLFLKMKTHVWGHKSEDSSFFGYKTHIGMTEERIITAAVIPQLSALVEQSRKNGIDVQTVIGDSAYSGKNNKEKARDEHFELVAKLNPSISQEFKKEEDKFDYNKDACMFLRPSIWLYIKQNKGKRKEHGIRLIPIILMCKCCSKRETCYKPRAKFKTYSVPIKNDEQLQQIEFQQTERFKEKAAERYKIEAKNAELKQVYGVRQSAVVWTLIQNQQGAIAIFTTNIKRILKLS